jgi:hypothetical protein
MKCAKQPGYSAKKLQIHKPSHSRSPAESVSSLVENRAKLIVVESSFYADSSRRGAEESEVEMSDERLLLWG